MALLTVEQRKTRFDYLGLGEYNKANILKFQKKAFPNNKAEWDSKYGLNTDRALRTFYNVKKNTTNFKPSEFCCTCGHCTGYPSYMKKAELQHIQKIRTHYNKSMTITSALRCSYENNRVGGVKNSGHMRGYAVDFYMPGVTDTVDNRVKALAWIKKQPNHEFTYGAHMKDSNGLYRIANGMGNAMHTETHAPPAAKTPQQKMVAWAKKIAADNSYHYVHWKKDDPKTKKCPVCNNTPKGKYHGWFCTSWVLAPWKHGAGIKMKCGNALNNGTVDRIYNAKTDAEALKIAQTALGLKTIKVIRSKKSLPQDKLKAGDMCYYFKGNGCQHAFFYIGSGKMIDANSYKDEAKQIAVRKAMTCRVAIRYTGK